MTKKAVLIRMPLIDDNNLLNKIITQKCKVEGFPDDFTIDRVDYEPTNQHLYIRCTSETFPVCRVPEEIPIIRLELMRNNKKEEIVKFSIRHSI